MFYHLPWTVTALWFFSVGLSCLLVIRLILNRLQRCYPMFLTYWVLDIVSLPVLGFANPANSAVFGSLCRVIGLLRCTLFVTMLGELWIGIRKDRSRGGIRANDFVQRAMFAALWGTVLTFFFDFRLELFESVMTSVNWVVWLERTINCSGVLFLLGLSLHVLSSNLRSNVVNHFLILTLYSFWKTAIGLVHTTLAFRYPDVISMLVMIGASVCQLLWARLLTEKGEQIPPSGSTAPSLDAETVLVVLGMLTGRLRAVSPRKFAESFARSALKLIGSLTRFARLKPAGRDH